jgi:hypothetical protein
MGQELPNSNEWDGCRYPKNDHAMPSMSGKAMMGLLPSNFH